MKTDVVLHELVAHGKVAGNCSRFVVVVGEHRIDLQFACKVWNRLAGTCVTKHQRSAEFSNCATQFANTFPDELDAPIAFVRQQIEDFRVEHEHAIHAPRRFQGVMKTGVVGDAQVAAEPEERGIEQWWGHSGVVNHAVNG